MSIGIIINFLFCCRDNAIGDEICNSNPRKYAITPILQLFSRWRFTNRIIDNSLQPCPFPSIWEIERQFVVDASFCCVCNFVERRAASDDSRIAFVFFDFAGFDASSFFGGDAFEEFAGGFVVWVLWDEFSLDGELQYGVFELMCFHRYSLSSWLSSMNSIFSNMRSISASMLARFSLYCAMRSRGGKMTSSS